MTTKLYQKDVYLKEWEAVILSILPATEEGEDGSPSSENRALLLTLDQTAFFPEGGGQSCDTGLIGGLRVVDVQEEGDQIIHKVIIPSGSDCRSSGDTSDPSCNLPAEGDRVSCSIDWDRRFDNMQRHCGEHILSGIFYARCGGVNRGFHMGDDYMTIDISLEDEPSDEDALRPDTIDMELALDCELRANRVVWSDAPVRVFLFDERDQVADMPLRKALAFEEDISIVCVGSPENISDCVACCGTHPSSAGQVGLIKIYKVENYKGMFRIYFDAGSRALKDYDRKHDILTSVANAHSSSIDDLPGALKAQEDKLAAAKNELHQLKDILIKRLREELDVFTSGKSEPSIFRVSDLSMNDTFELSKPYMGNVPFLLMLYVERETSFILVSDGNIHCGDLVREYASFYKGKGGGSNVSARAIFDSEEDAMLFADLLGKHLK